MVICYDINWVKDIIKIYYVYWVSLLFFKFYYDLKVKSYCVFRKVIEESSGDINLLFVK